MEGLLLFCIVVMAMFVGCGIGHAIYCLCVAIEDLIYQARMYNCKQNRYINR